MADVLHSPWGVCTALLGQLAMTLPIDPITGAPVGLNPLQQQQPLDLADVDTLASAVRNITRSAMQSGSPFVWHRDRRHAPSRSTVCASSVPASASPHPQAYLRVTGATILTPAGASPSIVVNQDQGQRLPLFGFLSRTIGQAAGGTQCVCALNHASDAALCQLQPDTCATVRAWLGGGGNKKNLSSGCAALLAGCASSGLTYSLDGAAAVLDCLRRLPPSPVTAALNQTVGGGVRCPELGPSDLWSLYPVGCGQVECAGAGAWVGAGAADALLNSAQFMNDGRAGLRLPNYAFVNATYHGALPYARQPVPAAAMAQPTCFDASDLAPSAADESAVPDFLADTVLERLFPAAQMTSDSPLVAVCSRFVIETARSEVLAGSRSAALQAAAWRRRCEAKVRDAAGCAQAGTFFQVRAHTFSDVLNPGRART